MSNGVTIKRTTDGNFMVEIGEDTYHVGSKVLPKFLELNYIEDFAKAHPDASVAEAVRLARVAYSDIEEQFNRIKQMQ